MAKSPLNAGSSSVGFLHEVGKSTLSQGITVPVSAQNAAMHSIEKGRTSPVTIVFGESGIVQASLRRINNVVGHLQFRYEAVAQKPLREFLQATFGRNAERSLLEVREVQPWVFRFTPVAALLDRRPVLALHAPLIAGADDRAVPLAALTQVGRVLSVVEYTPGHGQAEYNTRISAAFSDHGWRREVRVIEQLGLRVDFEKDDIWIEVEFGNARTYYQDYIKLSLARRFHQAKCGMLLSPTQPMASALCEVGAARAALRRSASGPRPSYSGMMTHEKALREFPYLQPLFANPLVIAGLHFVSPSANG